MSIVKIYRCPIWRHLPNSISFLSPQRKKLKRSSKSIRIGLNFSIILNSACFVEGVLETGLKALLLQRRITFNKISSVPEFYTRKTINTLFNNIEKDLDSRISRTTGLDERDELFKLLINQKISKFEKVIPLWEGIQVLFHFRNVIAHGREISARVTKGPETLGMWQESFTGGYKKAEDYLLKNKLLKKRFLEQDNEDIFFTDKIANHFMHLAKIFIKEISNSLSGEEKLAFDTAVFKGVILFEKK